MGGSLAIVAMLLSIWALTSMLHAQVGFSTFDVSGGLTLATCKDPCSDTHITSMTECYHPDKEDPNCSKLACAIQNIRYLVCTECEDAEPEADDCEYYRDYFDWWRSERIYYYDCNSTTYDEEPYGDRCSVDYFLNRGMETPCVWTAGCNGVEYNYKRLYGRLRCGSQ